MNVIYLHGFASSPGSRKATFFRERFFREGIPIRIPDLAEGDFEGLSITRQLKAVEREAAGEPVVLIGSSLGGYLAALHAARHPESQAVVLMAPAFDFAARWRLRTGESQMAQWQSTGWLPVFHYGEGGPARVGFQLYKDAMQYEAYPEVRQPALVLHGRNDDVVPHELSERFAAGRANADLHLLDSDHELTDVLTELWELTWQFLGRHGLR
jgi:hypothetical protein